MDKVSLTVAKWMIQRLQQKVYQEGTKPRKPPANYAIVHTSDSKPISDFVDIINKEVPNTTLGDTVKFPINIEQTVGFVEIYTLSIQFYGEEAIENKNKVRNLIYLHDENQFILDEGIRFIKWTENTSYIINKIDGDYDNLVTLVGEFEFFNSSVREVETIETISINNIEGV